RSGVEVDFVAGEVNQQRVAHLITARRGTSRVYDDDHACARHRNAARPRCPNRIGVTPGSRPAAAFRAATRGDRPNPSPSAAKVIARPAISTPSRLVIATSAWSVSR